MTVETVIIFLYNTIQIWAAIFCTIFLFFISIVTIIGLRKQEAVIYGYRKAILAIAWTHLIISLYWGILFPIRIYPLGAIYLAAQSYPDWVLEWTNKSMDFWMMIDMEFVALSILYRTLLVLRPNWANELALVFFLACFPVPIVHMIWFNDYNFAYQPACDFICLDETSPKVWRKMDITVRKMTTMNSWIQLSLILLVFIVGIPCTLILNRSFKHGNFSKKTMELQKRLTYMMTCMMLTHLAIFISGFTTSLADTVLGNLLGSQVVIILFIIGTIANNLMFPAEAWVLYLSVQSVLQTPKWLQKIVEKIRGGKNILRSHNTSQ